MTERSRIMAGADCPVCRQLPCINPTACSAALAAGEWTACLECGGGGRHSTEPRFTCPVCGGARLVPAGPVRLLLGYDAEGEQ